MNIASMKMSLLDNMKRRGTQRDCLDAFEHRGAASRFDGGRPWRRPWFVSVVAGLISLCAAGRGEAEIVYYMYGTGIGADLSTTSGTDQYWNIVALPGSATGYPSTPYDALVPRSTNVNWIGGALLKPGPS